MEVKKEEVEYIEGLFPDLKQINDPDIRRKVIEAFVYAWHHSIYPKN